MPKYELVPNAGDYAPVADRITLFYARYPNGRIVTRLLSRTAHEITVQAFVYRTVEEQRPSATGLAAERIGDGDVNTVACLENTETSAIGRALANLGLTASTQRPSRDEMDKVERARAARVSEAGRATAGAAPASPVRPAPSRGRPGLTSQAAGPRGLAAGRQPQHGSGAASPALQHRADRVMDALQLLAEAERAGLPPRRARRLRHAVTEAAASVAIVERVERALRAWTSGRHARDCGCNSPVSL